MADKRMHRIGEHLIPLPPVPKDTGEIYLYNEKPENAFWRRIEFPDIWYDYNKYYTVTGQPRTERDEDGRLIALSVQDTKKLQDLQTKEMQRRKRGLWMRNGTEIIWISPDYYFILQWAHMLQLPEKYGKYVEFQNDVCILVGHLLETETIIDEETGRPVERFRVEDLGAYFSKIKKTGVSQIITGIMCNRGTMMRSKLLGVRSKTYDEDVIPVNMAMIFLIIDNLPDILLPTIKKRNEHEIIFGKPQDWKKLKVTITPDSWLNTRIFATKTVPAAFDGKLMYIVWDDELPKDYETAKMHPRLAFDKTIATPRLQGVKKGVYLISSYPQEKDDVGYMECREIYKESKLSTKASPFELTTSKILAWHIRAEDSIFDAIDKYGGSDKAKANAIVDADRKRVEGQPKKLLPLVRQTAKDEAEAWGLGGITTVFNAPRLALQFTDLEDDAKSGKRNYTEGRHAWQNLAWEGGKWDKRPNGEFGIVLYEKLTTEEILSGTEHGRYRQYKPIRAEDSCRSIRANKRDLRGNLVPIAPPNGQCWNVAGNDPTDYRFASQVEEGSSTAIWCGNVWDQNVENIQGAGSTNVPVGLYLYDPENPNETLEDVIKFIIYHDCYILVEANKKFMVTALQDAGLCNFIMLKKKDGTIAPFDYDDEDRLQSTTGASWEDMVRAIKRYHIEPEPDSSDVDYLKLTKDKRAIKQLADFRLDVAKSRRKSDFVAALGLQRLAADGLIGWLVRKQPNDYDNNMVRLAFQTFIGTK